MAYISNGRVVEKPTGFVATIRSLLAALIAFVTLFLQSMINPDAVTKAKEQGQSRRGPGGSGGPGMGGGPGGGPRIRGLDNISGSSHAASCNPGG